MATIRRTDCEGFHRRDFLQIGAAGLLGPDAARLPRRRGEGREQGRDRQGEGQGRHPRLARRRPGDHRHVGHQARRPRGHPRRVQADRHDRRRRPDRRDTCRRWPQVARQGHRRPLAVPHHPVARPGHGLHDHRQQADRRRCSTRRWARSPRSCCRREPGVPPYVTFGDLRGGRAGRRRATSAPATTRSSSRATAAAAASAAARLPRPRHHAAERHSRSKTWRSATSCCSKLRRAASRALDKPNDLVDGLDTFHQQALEILRSRQDEEGVRPERREAGDVRERYGTTPFGQGALAARRLVEAGVRFVTVSLGGWDTHSQTFNAHKTRLAADRPTPCSRR